MSLPDGAAREWAEREYRRVEIRAAATSLGVRDDDLEILLEPLLVCGCSRPRAQSLLEQAWGRLQALRARIGELRADFQDPDVSQALERAQRESGTAGIPSVLSAVESLEQAFDASREQQMADVQTARLRATHALAVAVTMDFRRAADLGEDAAAMAENDPDACWQYRVQQAQFLLDHGREFGDAESLNELRHLCEDTLLHMVDAQSRPDERAWVYDCLGQARGILGGQQRGIDMLRQATTAFEQALELRPRERSPDDWAATQNYLGNAIGSLGQRTQDPELLRRAIAAFEAALEVPSSNAAPDARASVQCNLAAVAQILGRHQADAEMLDRAIAGFRAALATWTVERRPMDWAATMNNLGGALRMQGHLRQDQGLLEKSVASYRGVLSVRTRERLPLEWAVTQNDLGAALQALGEHTEDLLPLGRAVTAYREATREITRERDPMGWAMTMANLGVARCKLAEGSRDATIAKRAAEDIAAAVDVFREASHPELSSLGLEQLAIAREVSAMLEASTES